MRFMMIVKADKNYEAGVPPSSELIGGYAILRTESKQEAIELGKQFMKLHADILGPSYEGELEIRQLADLAPPVTKEVTAGSTRAS